MGVSCSPIQLISTILTPASSSNWYKQPDKLLGRIDLHPSEIGVFAAISEALFEEQVRVGIIVEAVDLGPAAATVELACFR
jgi:hypothetical protein